MNNKDFNKERLKGLKEIKNYLIDKETYDTTVKYRRAGYTHGQALKIVGEAMSSPNTAISLYMDTRGPTHVKAIRHILLPLVIETIDKMGFSSFTVDKENLTITRNIDFPDYDDL